MMRIALVVLGAYLLGSVSGSVLLSRRVYGQDVRALGSGNAGATNMARCFGMKAGLGVLALDVIKTVLACVGGRALLGETGFCLAGLACGVGHCRPVFFRFSGGKGVSVGAAVALMLGWRFCLPCMVCFFLLFALTKIVSVCSMGSAVLMPILALLEGLPTTEVLLTAGVAALVLVRHRQNLRRLLRGREPRFRPAKKSPPLREEEERR